MSQNNFKKQNLATIPLINISSSSPFGGTQTLVSIQDISIRFPKYSYSSRLRYIYIFILIHLFPMHPFSTL